MDARQSFLSIGESIAAAPGPGYYSHVINNAKIKGGTSIDDKVCLYFTSCAVPSTR